MKTMDVLQNDAPKAVEVSPRPEPKSEEIILSFVQFTKQYREHPMLLAALKLEAANEKHSLTDWIARVQAFGVQAA